MSNALFEELRNDPDMQDKEYRHAWAEGRLNSMIAMQIKILREQRDWTQTQLAHESDMAQSRISLLEDVNYTAWSISTLKRLALAFDVRLKVSFEEFGSLADELAQSGRGALERASFSDDLRFNGPAFENVAEAGSDIQLLPVPDSTDNAAFDRSSIPQKREKVYLASSTNRKQHVGA